MNPFQPGGKLHWAKNLYLRWRDGAGCCDTYTLYPLLAKKILPSLRAFRKRAHYSHPTAMPSVEAWQETLDEMIWGFEYYADEGRFNTGKSIEEEREDARRADRGIAWFAAYFGDLWI